MAKQYFITGDDLVIHKIIDGEFDYTKHLDTNESIIFFDKYQDAVKFREDAKQADFLCECGESKTEEELLADDLFETLVELIKVVR